MEDIIVIAVVAIIVGLATLYIYKAKKSGKACIGCPDACSCSSKNGQSSCSCGCGGSSETTISKESRTFFS